MKTKGKITKADFYSVVHRALKDWNLPSKKGLEAFNEMLVPREFGYHKYLPIVAKRMKINQMMLFFIQELGLLQPVQTQILTRRFLQLELIKKIAISLNLSEEQVNRLQKSAIKFVVELILDREFILRRLLKKP